VGIDGLDAKFERIKAGYQANLLNLTQARMALGTASLKERLAYRFPRLCGGFSEQARMDRINPAQSPSARWYAAADAFWVALRNRDQEGMEQALDEMRAANRL